jgi:hypothetical protein
MSTKIYVRYLFNHYANTYYNSAPKAGIYSLTHFQNVLSVSLASILSYFEIQNGDNIMMTIALLG